MDLDDLSTFYKLDPQNMIGEIDRLPDQLEQGWTWGNAFPLPDFHQVKQVLISGMGGSAIGADLLAAYVAPTCSLPIIVHRDYDLPAWAHGPETLVIACSHSGNTEETLSSFKCAQVKGCSLLAITTGGRLAQEAQAASVPCWVFEHAGQPRAAVGLSFGILLAFFYRLGSLPNPASDLAGALAALRSQQENLKISVPVTKNPAKRFAGQLFGRYASIFGSGYLAPVSRRWKTQINELAKAWAQFEFIPEADHNTMAGLVYPEKQLEKIMVIFLQAPSEHPRNQLRLELTRKGFMQEGLNTDFYTASGDNPLAHIWTALHFGDYLAFYLAMCYGIDPTPVAAIETLKAEMKR
jgi:glucose/mannose-6-phosphate isomerase